MDDDDEEEPPHYLMQFFSDDHLPSHLAAVSKEFAAVAHTVDSRLPHNPEREAALRKLLEAKDCAVRSVIFNG